MPSRVQWEPTFAVGHEAVDAQHRALLEQASRLADLCQDGPAFDAAFEQVKGLVRSHRDAEAALLAAAGHAGLDDHQAEFEEFDAVVDDVATPEHFDRDELQVFVAHWCLAHVAGAASAYGSDLARAAR